MASVSDLARLLLVEDDRSMREGLASALRGRGYAVDAQEDGRAVSGLAAEELPDLALLDVRLPDGPGGIELAGSLRDRGVPVVFITAADALEEKLRGFAAGADDYLVKPFAIAELLARIEVSLRRSGHAVAETWQAADLVITDASRRVVRRGTEIELTKTELALLTVLARSPSRTFSKRRLLSLVWGFDEYDDNLVEVHVSALRRKLEVAGRRLIHTERGEGYVFR